MPLQHTTWTTGRNILAQTAYKKEIFNKNKYKFWTFIDADVMLYCITDNDSTSNKYNIDDSCFPRYTQFVNDADQPIVVLLGYGSTPFLESHLDKYAKAVTKVQSFDAIVNTFRRDTIDIVLPYIPDLDSNTWWSSQGILWHFIQCFYPNFATAPASIFIENPDHSNYPKNARSFNDELLMAMRRLNGTILPIPPVDQAFDLASQSFEFTASLDHYWFNTSEQYLSCKKTMSSYGNSFLIN
jgi:hypothetical protein